MSLLIIIMILPFCILSLLEILNLQKLAHFQRKTEKKQHFEVETTLIIPCQSFVPRGCLSSDTTFFEMNISNTLNLINASMEISVANPRTAVI